MRAALAALCVLLVSGAAFAQFPQHVPYQGYLTDENGVPIDGQADLTFRIYDSAQGGDPMWEEVWAGVSVTDGAFFVMLGELSPVSSTIRETPGGYLAIKVNEDVETLPRVKLGSVPYALLAYDSERLGGVGADQFLTQEEIIQLIQDQDFVTNEEVLQIIRNNGGGGGITREEVIQIIDDRNYLSRDQILALIGDGQGITIEVLNEVLDQRQYVTEERLTEVLLDYVTNVVLNERLATYVTIDVLNQRLENYVTREEYLDLLARVEALENGQGNNRGPYILGVSAQNSNGRVSFNNQNGMRGANEMCLASYEGEATAHLCTPDEALRALNAGAYPAERNFDNVQTWTIGYQIKGNSFNDGLGNSCQNLMYNSGDVATGTTLAVDLDYQSNGNGGGVTGHVIKLQSEVGCGGNFRVLCCR